METVSDLASPDTGIDVPYSYYLRRMPWTLGGIPSTYTGTATVERGPVVILWSADRAGDTYQRNAIETPLPQQTRH